MSKGFTTNNPDDLQVYTGKGVVMAQGLVLYEEPGDAVPVSNIEALVTSMRERDAHIDELRQQLADVRAERDRWVAYNGRLEARLQAVREALK